MARFRSLFSFAHAEHGAVAPIFGISSVVLFLIIGLSIDYVRMVDMRQSLVAAVDSASLASGRALMEGTLSDSEIIALAKTYFVSNAKSASKMGVIPSPTVSIDRDTGTVQIDVAATLALTVSQIGGFKTWQIPVTSTSIFKQRDIEVGMALDVTGSMNDVIGGKRKIDALKTAFATFADKVIPDQNDGHKARIGLAPYSAGINLGSYAGQASSYRSKDGCITERRNGGASDDQGPFYVAADGTKDIDSTEGYGSYVCPSAKLTALSGNKSELIGDVNAYGLSSSTGGHLGVQWAWNIVSDKWGSTWGGDATPASFDLVKQGKLLKAVVLMTDGIFNTSFHGAKSSTQAVDLCTAMKAEGIIVFTVGFGLGGNQTAINTLKSCATPGSDYFVDAASPEELQAAFSKFAGQLSQLRLSR